MDFITREDEDLEYTELLYGKKSDQYTLKKKLLDAEAILLATGKLQLGKECTREYIVYLEDLYGVGNLGTQKK